MNYLNTLFILGVAFVAVFLEAWGEGARDVFGAQIDLLPALVVYTALTHGIVATASLAVCGGLWFDSLSCNPLGVSVLPLFMAGFVIFQCRDLLLRDNPFAQIVLGAGASLVCPFLSVFAMLSSGASPLLGWPAVWQFTVMAVGGGLLTPLIFRLFDRIHGALNYQPVVQTTFRPDRQIKRGRS